MQRQDYASSVAGTPGVLDWRWKEAGALKGLKKTEKVEGIGIPGIGDSMYERGKKARKSTVSLRNQMSHFFITSGKTTCFNPSPNSQNKVFEGFLF